MTGTLCNREDRRGIQLSSVRHRRHYYRHRRIAAHPSNYGAPRSDAGNIPGWPAANGRPAISLTGLGSGERDANSGTDQGRASADGRASTLNGQKMRANGGFCRTPFTVFSPASMIGHREDKGTRAPSSWRRTGGITLNPEEKKMGIGAAARGRCSSTTVRCRRSSPAERAGERFQDREHPEHRLDCWPAPPWEAPAGPERMHPIRQRAGAVPGSRSAAFGAIQQKLATRLSPTTMRSRAPPTAAATTWSAPSRS